MCHLFNVICVSGSGISKWRKIYSDSHEYIQHCHAPYFIFSIPEAATANFSTDIGNDFDILWFLSRHFCVFMTVYRDIYAFLWYLCRVIHLKIWNLRYFCVFMTFISRHLCRALCVVSLRWYLRFKFIIGNTEILIREVDEINPEVCFFPPKPTNQNRSRLF